MPRPIGIPHRRESHNIRAALGAVVTNLRIKKGFSQAALAEKLGYTTSYISKLERGGMNPTLRTLFDLADALGVAVGVMVSSVRRRFERSRADRHS
jgi:transcriptional regulator with XRE-family HTH domain